MEQIIVVIAEDEPAVARYIKKILESLGGFKAAAICESGEEAVVQCQKEKPQLLITDIKMPGISGLDLIRQIKLQGTEVQTVIISGFKNFDYAKQAIALGVEDYITKPIHPEELKNTLYRIRNTCWQEASMEGRFRMEKAMRSRDETYLKERFPYQQCSILMVYQSGEAEDMDYQDNYCEYRISFFYRNALLVLDGGNEQEALERMRKIVRQVTFSKKRKKTCTTMLIRRMDLRNECFSVFQRLHRILREFTVPGKGVSVEYVSADRIKRKIEFFDKSLMKKTENHIAVKEWQAVADDLRGLFDFWEENRYAIYRINMVLHQIADWLRKAGVFTQDKLFAYEYLDDCIRYADSYMEMKDTVCSYLEEVLRTQHLDQQDRRDADHYYEEIRLFVLRNEDKNFSLNEISNLFGISQPYIRKIFRTHVGLSYNEWVLNEKIERAKDLLRTSPRLLVKDVAEMLGYEQLYFSTVFNKYTGMSPSAYKFLQHGRREEERTEM